MNEIAELKAALQRANDMLNGVMNQRNASANECVQLAAAIIEKDRAIAQRDARIAELETQIKPKDDAAA